MSHGNLFSFNISEHRVTSFRDLMHEDEHESDEEEGERSVYCICH